MDLEKMYELGFTPEQIVDAVNHYMSSDTLAYIMYHMCNENDVPCPTEIEEHYKLHCEGK